MGTVTRVKGYTFEEFCLLVKDGQKADLIDGVIYMASPDNMDANDLFVWLLRLLGDIVEIQDLGKGKRLARRLPPERRQQPGTGRRLHPRGPNEPRPPRLRERASRFGDRNRLPGKRRTGL